MKENTLLGSLFGTRSTELILLYMIVYREGATSTMATTFGMNKNRIYSQLKRLEEAGIIVGRTQGNQRLFAINPRLYFRAELEALLRKGLKLVSEEDREKYFTERRRPRRTGKPL